MDLAKSQESKSPSPRRANSVGLASVDSKSDEAIEITSDSKKKALTKHLAKRDGAFGKRKSTFDEE